LAQHNFDGEIGVALSAITKRPANQSNCQHDQDHPSSHTGGSRQRAPWVMREIRGNQVVHTPPVRGKRPDDYSGARNAKKEIARSIRRRAGKKLSVTTRHCYSRAVQRARASLSLRAAGSLKTARAAAANDSPFGSASQAFVSSA
jgi:hypothetical protein